MFSREESENHEHLFRPAYEFAKNQDVVGLQRLLDDADVGFDDIHIVDKNSRYGFDEISVIYLLALDGHDAAVDWLIEAFKNYEDNYELDDAAAAYVGLSRIDRVMELLAKGASAQYVLELSCWYGNTQLVESILTRYPETPLNSAISEAVKKGHLELGELLCRRGGSVKVLVDWLAYEGHLARVNDWIEQGTKHKNRKAVARALGNTGHFNSHDAAVTALSHFDGEYTRKSLFKYIAEKFRKNLKQRQILHDATKRNAIMHKYGISSEQAKALQVKGLRAWMLQGRQKPHVSTLMNRDVFFKILSEVTTLSRQDAEDLYGVVCDNTLSGAKELLLAKQPSTLFSKRYGIHGAVRGVRHRDELVELENHYPSKKIRMGE